MEIFSNSLILVNYLEMKLRVFRWGSNDKGMEVGRSKDLDGICLVERIVFEKN